MFSMVKEVNSTELSQLLSEEGAISLYDVRTPAEIAAGIIPGTQAMPLTALPMRLQDFPKDKQVVLYCRSGARSAQACMFMSQQGFDNVYNLRGGIMDWARNGLPIEPGQHLLA